MITEMFIFAREIGENDILRASEKCAENGFRPTVNRRVVGSSPTCGAKSDEKGEESPPLFVWVTHVLGICAAVYDGLPGHTRYGYQGEAANVYFGLMMITESIRPFPSSSVAKFAGSFSPTPSTRNL